MNLNNITFPYPVLGSYDDILPAPSRPEIEITQDKQSYFFNIKLGYNNAEIEDLVNEDYADYVCEVTCDMTKYRKCFNSKCLHFELCIPRRCVAGKINFACTITLKKDYQNYTNKGFHPDYLGHSFDMEAGDILGILGLFYYNADIKYDELKAFGTFMEINETDDILPSTILDKDKIDLRLPTVLYHQYKDNPAVNSKADVLHASVVLNSLMYALCRIDRHIGKKWADTIIYRIDTEQELEEFRDQDPEEWRVDKLAQLLLGKPYERLFNYLAKEQNQD
jgi:hypothetical protein